MKRQRRVNGHAWMNTARQEAADLLQVPVEAIKIVRPNGRKVRDDSRLEALQRVWKKYNER